MSRVAQAGAARVTPTNVPLALTHAEPYLEHVSIVTLQPLSPAETRDRLRTDRAKVATYRQPAPGSLTLSENPSPNHGSQAPFHQR